jgi:hypothetical protein
LNVYLTHCSAKKNDSLKGTSDRVTPDQLYTATPTKRFIVRCKERDVNWAIFSDKYGVWFSTEKHEHYEKDPRRVTAEEFDALLENFNRRLGGFDEIWFYYNPGRFHPLYKKLLSRTRLKKHVHLFSHISEIES